MSCIFVHFLPQPLPAQAASGDLRKIARNPFAGVIKLPLEADINFDQGTFHRASSDFEIQPVLPWQITSEWLLVTRIVADTFVYQPNLAHSSGGTAGFGDTTATFFLTPAETRNVIWGVGPTLLLPTATNSTLGSGKWGLGPSFVVVTLPDWGSLGVLVQQVWSVSGGPRQPINQLQLQPAFSYNLSRNWYLTTSPTLVADWTQSPGHRWTLPAGGGAGKTFRVSKRSMDSNLTLYWNAIRPSQSIPSWQVSLQVTLLFTE